METFKKAWVVELLRLIKVHQFGCGPMKLSNTFDLDLKWALFATEAFSYLGKAELLQEGIFSSSIYLPETFNHEKVGSRKN